MSPSPTGICSTLSELSLSLCSKVSNVTCHIVYIACAENTNMCHHGHDPNTHTRSPVFTGSCCLRTRFEQMFVPSLGSGSYVSEGFQQIAISDSWTKDLHFLWRKAMCWNLSFLSEMCNSGRRGWKRSGKDPANSNAYFTSQLASKFSVHLIMA